MSGSWDFNLQEETIFDETGSLSQGTEIMLENEDESSFKWGFFIIISTTILIASIGKTILYIKQMKEKPNDTNDTNDTNV